MGNLTNDPELRETANGNKVTNLRIAVNEPTKDGDGRTTFADISVWGSQAISCKKYLSKGSSVLIEGPIRNKEYEGKTGKVKTFEVNANTVQFLGGKRD